MTMSAVDVVGLLDGVVYHVRLHPDGEVDGSDRVARMISMHEGREVEVGGFGTVTADGSQEAAFGLLLTYTQVYRVDGPLPGRFGTVG